MKLNKFSFVSLLMGFAVLFFSLSGNANWESNLRNFALAIEAPGSAGRTTFTNARLGYQTSINDHTDFVADYELTLSWQNETLSGLTQLVPNAYRADDLQNPVEISGDRQLVQNLDRFFVKSGYNSVDFTVGRQPLSFGVGRLVSPTDVFLPFPVIGVGNEYRPGIDAIRTQWATGDFSELDIGLVGGQQNNGFVRFRSNWRETDFEVIVLTFQSRKLLGGSLQGSISDLGAWLEAAYVADNGPDPGYLRATAGLEKWLEKNSYFYLEWHFNEAGTLEKKNYLANANSFAYTSGSTFLLSQHYLLNGFRWRWSDLTTVSHSLLYNISDASFYFLNHLESSLTEDLYLEVGLYYGDGAAQTEFFESADLAFLGLRYYWL